MAVPTVILLLLILQVHSITSQFDIMCKTLGGYSFLRHFGHNCYFNSDTSLQAPELIEKYAGDVQFYEVVSQDGYILTLFRMPPPKQPKGVILLHHSVAIDARAYLWDGNQSIAFQLWSAGYDVWLANQRGTFYSSRHLAYSDSEFRYWNFGFHEMALYDISSELTAIKANTNGSKIIYVGHSLGSLIGLTYLTLKPEEAKENFKAFALASTPCYYKYGTSPVYLIAPFGPFLKWFSDLIRWGAVIPLFSTIVQIAGPFLRIFPAAFIIGNWAISAILGWTPEATDARFLNFDTVKFISNFPWKIFIHAFQLVQLKTRFQMYDYGKEGNIIEYGTETPPLYPIEKISVPLLLISSENDTLTSSKDSELFLQSLPESVPKLGHQVGSGYNHAQFYFCKDRGKLWFDEFLRIISQL